MCVCVQADADLAAARSLNTTNYVRAERCHEFVINVSDAVDDYNSSLAC